MEEKRIRTQIALYMTNKKLCEFNDKLKAAPVEYYGHLHAEGKRTGDTNRHRSCIGIVLQDYSNGTGSQLVRVTANLSPEFFPYALSRVCQGVESFEFFEEKVFSSTDDDGLSQVTKVSIRRTATDKDGKTRNYPWLIAVENGRAIGESTQTGGIHIKKGTYKKERNVFVTISDYDFFRLMLQTTRFIHVWELTVGPKQIRDALGLLEQQHTSGKSD